MTKTQPWKFMAGAVGAVLLVVVAFRAPVAGSAVAEPTAPAAADGAAVLAAVDAVTSPPETQPTIQLPVPGAGDQPTQVVVVSVDGGCETRDGTIRDFLATGARVSARFTFFLSGLCLVPESHRMEYRPPGRLPGQSDVPFADATMVAGRLAVFAETYRAGHELGTHFLGHFCGENGVAAWNADQWRDEIRQSRHFLDEWTAYNPLAAGAETLPFDSSVLRGTRTPCLEGDRDAMHAAFAAESMRYEASDPGVLQWPRKADDADLWLFPLPALKLPSSGRWVLSMDYNLLVNQNGGRTEGDAATCRRVEEETRQTYLDALRAVHSGNRAPLVVGSHLNDWLCGAYIEGIKRFLVDAAAEFPDVRFISFADLADWLDRMPPDVLSALQERPAQRY